MYEAKIIQIMVGTPSDTEKERESVLKIFSSWNNMHTFSRKVCILPLHWSFSAIPTAGNTPQTSLNQQLVDRSDALVCIFGKRLGTPTDDYPSGTAEEIAKHIEAGKPVMLFVNECPGIGHDKQEIEEYSKLCTYIEQIQNQVLYKTYSDIADFEEQLRCCLEIFMDKVCSKSSTNNHDNTIADGLRTDKLSGEHIHVFSVEQIELLKKWVKCDDAGAHYIDFMGNKSTFIFGNYQVNVNNGKERTEYLDLLSELEKLGAVIIERYDKRGKPVYRLTTKGYNFIENL